jgi:hypothetical protein
MLPQPGQTAFSADLQETSPILGPLFNCIELIGQVLICIKTECISSTQVGALSNNLYAVTITIKYKHQNFVTQTLSPPMRSGSLLL